MDAVWYIKIDGREEGPYSVGQLKRDCRITPDTLVRKKGSKSWTPIRYVAELKEIFADEESVPLHQKKKGKELSLATDELVLDYRNDNFPFLFFWILIMTLILSYILNRLNAS